MPSLEVALLALLVTPPPWHPFLLCSPKLQQGALPPCNGITGWSELSGPSS